MGGLLASLLLHGIVLLLQFGVPGLGMPGAPPPLSVRIANVDIPPLPPLPPPPPPPPPPPVPAPDPAVAAPLAAARAGTGMRLVDPVAAPEPMPPPMPTLTGRSLLRSGPDGRKVRLKLTSAT